MNECARDIADLLEDQSALGLTVGTNLFVHDRPETPDLCVSLHESTGEPPDANIDYDRCAVQMIVRSAKGDPHASYVVAKAVRDYMKTVTDETINGARIIGVWVQGDLGYIGRDENGRGLWSANFRVHRTTAS